MPNCLQDRLEIEHAILRWEPSTDHVILVRVDQHVGLDVWQYKA